MGLLKQLYTDLYQGHSGRRAKIRRQAVLAEEHIRERFGTPVSTHRDDGVEIGPGGWRCPAWEEGGRRCAFYLGVVHVWNGETLMFEAAPERRPPWDQDTQELAEVF